MEAAVRGVARPIPGLVALALASVVVLSGIVAPLLAGNGFAFVFLAGLAGALVGVALLVAIPALLGRHRPVVVVLDGDVVRVFERTPTDRLGEQLLSGGRSELDPCVPPAWRAFLAGFRGGYVTVEATRVGLSSRLVASPRS